MTKTRATPTQATLDRLKDVVGTGAFITDQSEMAPFVHEWRDRYVGRTPLVVLPNSTEQVSHLVSICQETKTAIVPQGGNTGAVAGQIPFEDGTEIVLSLKRLNKIRAVDTGANTMTVDGGVILQTIQGTADAHDRLFPLSLASEGSCQIGGNLATNAGGTAVLRYGNARDLVLGLEVVLADGKILGGLNALRKDNTGYDLRHLFMGSEGTLGLITGAVLKLFPKPTSVETAFVAVASPQAAIETLGAAQSVFGQDVTTFELLPRIALDFVSQHAAGTKDPFTNEYPWYVLIEIASALPDLNLKSRLEHFLEKNLNEAHVLDGTIAQSGDQRLALWRLREAIPEAQKPEGGSIKHDISVPISSIPQFLEKADAAVSSYLPGIRPVPFGHLGDGNIHYNLTQPTDMARDTYLARWDEVNSIVHDIVSDFDGSVSAEHGIGRMKVSELERYKDPVALDLMRQLKRTFDPHNILNPGKVVRI